MHYPGIINQAADAQLQLAIDGRDTSPLKDDIPLLVLITHTPENIPRNNDNATSPQSFQPQTRMMFPDAQVSKAYCRMKHAQVGHSKSKSNVNTHSLLVQTSPIYGALQIFEPPPLGRRTLMLRHHPPIARHLGHCCRYDTLPRKLNMPHMAADVDQIFSKRQSCPRNKPIYRHKHEFQIFP